MCPRVASLLLLGLEVGSTTNAVNFEGLIFGGLAAQKHSRVVEFTLSRCSLVIFVPVHKS